MSGLKLVNSSFPKDAENQDLTIVGNEHPREMLETLVDGLMNTLQQGDTRVDLRVEIHSRGTRSATISGAIGDSRPNTSQNLDHFETECDEIVKSDSPQPRSAVGALGRAHDVTSVVLNSSDSEVLLGVLNIPEVRADYARFRSECGLSPAEESADTELSEHLQLGLRETRDAVQEKISELTSPTARRTLMALCRTGIGLSMIAYSIALLIATLGNGVGWYVMYAASIFVLSFVSIFYTNSSHKRLRSITRLTIPLVIAGSNMVLLHHALLNESNVVKTALYHMTNCFLALYAVIFLWLGQPLIEYSNAPQNRRERVHLFLAMGWVLWIPLWNNLLQMDDILVPILVVFGGFAYTLGGVIYKMSRPTYAGPTGRWYAAITLGAASHAWAIWRLAHA